MSKVNILWMYDDLLDLYGDWGNLLAVTKGLDAMGIPWEIEMCIRDSVRTLLRRDQHAAGVFANRATAGGK